MLPPAGKRSRAQDHAQAEALIATIEPGGKSAAKKFREVTTTKDDSHYGLVLTSESKANGDTGRALLLNRVAGRRNTDDNGAMFASPQS